MIIGVDLDGVLADTFVSLANYYNQRHGTVSDVKTYEKCVPVLKVWLAKEGPLRDELFDFFASGEAAQIKPIQDSVKAIRELSQKHQLLVVTARHDTIIDLTKGWLDKYFPNAFSGFHFAYNSQFPEISVVGERTTKAELCRKLRIDLLIDDNFTPASEAAVLGVKTFLFDQPWNENQKKLPAGLIRVHSWKEILSRLEEKS